MEAAAAPLLRSLPDGGAPEVDLREVLVPGGRHHGEGRMWSKTAPPGRYFDYVNFNSGLIATIMERASGERRPPGLVLGLNALFVFDPKTNNGMIYVTTGVGAAPDAQPGRFSSEARFQERITDALYRGAILP